MGMVSWQQLVIQNSSGSAENQGQDALCGDKRDFRIVASPQKSWELQPSNRTECKLASDVGNLFTPILSSLFWQVAIWFAHLKMPATTHTHNSTNLRWLEKGECVESEVPLKIAFILPLAVGQKHSVWAAAAALTVVYCYCCCRHLLLLLVYISK